MLPPDTYDSDRKKRGVILAEQKLQGSYGECDKAFRLAKSSMFYNTYLKQLNRLSYTGVFAPFLVRFCAVFKPFFLLPPQTAKKRLCK